MSQTIIQRLAERIRSFGDQNITKQAIEPARVTPIVSTIAVRESSIACLVMF